MCGTCGCGPTEKPVQYRCDCDDDCDCDIIGFDEEPIKVPYCCDRPMKRIR